jgi:hypothetical protein
MSGPGATDVLRDDRVSDGSGALREELRRAVFPRYHVGDEIGSGGMAFVFRGYDTERESVVAFKALKRQYASLLGPTRFLREIRLLGQLRHPSILPLLDSGHTDTLFWYTMPLVEGETLQARLEREPQLPLEQVRTIVSRVAAALDHAHDAGIVHRDIKPSNLFLRGDEVLVADFGIAKDLTHVGEESTTSTGLIVGTALYMSPEQAEGHHHPDRRADVYSLGCVAYQMVAGEPPFSGPTSQAVIARHRSMPAPSARVVRPELPLGVDAVIRQALAKSPADRYQRAGDFADALSDPKKLAAAARAARAETEPARRRWVAPLAFAAVLLALAGYLLWPTRPLDANKVVVFPLGETPPQANSEGAGIEVALMIGSALEYTEPLQWIDGLPLLEAPLRGEVAPPTAADARRIARGAGARWYVDGTVIRRRDSVSVVVRLNDAAGDSVLGRHTVSGPAPEAAHAGLSAINRLLPKLLSPGQRMADLSALADRRPAAVAMWLQGEREYRRSNFEGALDFQRRAVAADSALAVAALRGAQAASWLSDMAEAGALARAALAHDTLLPRRLAEFGRGLNAYLGGEADSAVRWLGLALQKSPDWTEAHMALGEVYYHLLPSVPGSADSLARVEFELAAADTGFSPPRYHLAEIAIRGRDPGRARTAVDGILPRAQDPEIRLQLQVMLACVTDGRGAVGWKGAALEAPLVAFRAARMLAASGAHPGCAEDGFAAVFDNPDAPLGYRWGAFLGLQGLLATEGRVTELRALVDSAVARGLGLAPQVYLLDALAGADVAAQASAEARRLAPGRIDTMYSFTLALLGAWWAHSGSRALADSARGLLVARAGEANDPWVRRLADGLEARLRLLDGDTAAAIGLLRMGLGLGRRDHLEQDLAEPAAGERLLLAELLLARGDPGAARSAAAILDHPAPTAFLPFLSASLELRRRAAMALGDGREARALQERLLALGQTAGSSRPRSPSPLPEAR